MLPVLNEVEIHPIAIYGRLMLRSIRFKIYKIMRREYDDAVSREQYLSVV